MGVSLNSKNGPEEDEGLTCLSDSLSQLSLLKPEFAGIEKSFAQISLISKEEEKEEEGKVKDAEEKEEERGQDIDEELKTERRTNEEEKEKKHEVVKEDKKLARDEEEKREEKEEEEEKEDKIEKKEKEVCLDGLNKRKEDLKENERVLTTEDVKRKEEKELSKVTITSIPKNEDKDVDKLDAKVKSEKIETEEDEEHSSGEESSDEEEEKQNRKAPGKAPKYRSRGIDDIRSDLYNIIEYHSPSHSYAHDHSLAPNFAQPTQPQFHHSPQYGQSPSYSAMSPSYLGMGGVHDQTSFMTDRVWLPLSPAPSSTDDNDSNLSYNDLSSGMASNYSQLNDQYNQPLQIGDQHQYGQCFPQQLQSGAEFSQLVSSHSPAQSLVPDYYVQLQQEESPSPQMFDNSYSPQQQPSLLYHDQASPQPTEVLPLQSTEYSEDLDFACKLLKDEVEHPSRTQFSEAEVASIKEELIAFQKMEPDEPANCIHPVSTQHANYIHPATIQPFELPDYTWDMKCNEALFMKQFKLTAKWSNSYVTYIDPDGDTPSMVLACKPAKAAGYAEELRAVVERQKGVDMCCGQLVPQDQGNIPVCQFCHNSNSLNFHSSLGIRNKQGDTILSSVVRMGYPASVIRFVLDNLRPADLPRIFTSVDAQFYAGYAQYYPELQKYQQSYQ